MNGTEFPDIPPVRLAPLGVYAEMSHDNFLQVVAPVKKAHTVADAGKRLPT